MSLQRKTDSKLSYRIESFKYPLSYGLQPDERSIVQELILVKAGGAAWPPNSQLKLKWFDSDIRIAREIFIGKVILSARVKISFKLDFSRSQQNLHKICYQLGYDRDCIGEPLEINIDCNATKSLVSSTNQTKAPL